MRPPEKPLETPEQVLILDTVPELDVIRVGLDDRRFMDSLVMRNFARGLGLRFWQETMHQPPGADKFDDRMVWNDGAELVITLQDINFALAAAQRIINQCSPVSWIANKVTKRKAAAIYLVAALEPIIAAREERSDEQ